MSQDAVVDLPAWVHVGSEVRWWSVAQKTYHPVVVTSIDWLKRRAIVHFKADRTVWKTVPFTQMGHGGPLKPLAAPNTSLIPMVANEEGTLTPPWYEGLNAAESRKQPNRKHFKNNSVSREELNHKDPRYSFTPQEIAEQKQAQPPWQRKQQEQQQWRQLQHEESDSDSSSSDESSSAPWYERLCYRERRLREEAAAAARRGAILKKQRSDEEGQRRLEKAEDETPVDNISHNKTWHQGCRTAKASTRAEAQDLPDSNPATLPTPWSAPLIRTHRTLPGHFNNTAPASDAAAAASSLRAVEASEAAACGPHGHLVRLARGEQRGSTLQQAPTNLQEATLAENHDSSQPLTAFSLKCDIQSNTTGAVVAEAKAEQELEHRPGFVNNCLNTAPSSVCYQNGHAETIEGSFPPVGHAGLPHSAWVHVPAASATSAESLSIPNSAFEVAPVVSPPWQAPSSTAGMRTPAAPAALPPWRAARATQVAGVHGAETACSPHGAAGGMLAPPVAAFVEQPNALLATAGSVAPLAVTSPQPWHIGGLLPHSDPLPPPPCHTWWLPTLPLGSSPDANSLCLPQPDLCLQQLPPRASGGDGAVAVQSAEPVPMCAAIQGSSAADVLGPQLLPGALPFNTISVVAATDGPISLGNVAVAPQSHLQPPLEISSALPELAVAEANSAMKVGELGTTLAEPCRPPPPPPTTATTTPTTPPPPPSPLPDRKENQQPWIEQGTEELVRNTAVITDTELYQLLRAESPKGGAQQDLPCDAETKQEDAKPERVTEEQNAKQGNVIVKDWHAEQEVAEQEQIHHETCRREKVEQPQAVQENAEQQKAHLETVEWERTREELADQEKTTHKQQHGAEEERPHQDSACIMAAQKEDEQQKAERERAEREKAEREKEVLELRIQKAILQGELEALNKMKATQAKLGGAQRLNVQSKHGEECVKSLKDQGETLCVGHISAPEEGVLASEGILGTFLTSVRNPTNAKQKCVFSEQEVHDSQYKRRRLSSFLGA